MDCWHGASRWIGFMSASFLVTRNCGSAFCSGLGGPVSWGHVSWPERSGRSPLYRRNPLYLLRERRLDEVSVSTD